MAVMTFCRANATPAVINPTTVVRWLGLSNQMVSKPKINSTVVARLTPCPVQNQIRSLCDQRSNSLVRLLATRRSSQSKITKTKVKNIFSQISSLNPIKLTNCDKNLLLAESALDVVREVIVTRLIMPQL
jgi:hypothetical protein